MARSHKDGKHGGGHRNRTGREYWTPRGEPAMSPGRWAKDRTHSMERAEARRIEYDAMRDPFTSDLSDYCGEICEDCGCPYDDPAPCFHLREEKENVEEAQRMRYDEYDDYGFDDWYAYL